MLAISVVADRMEQRAILTIVRKKKDIGWLQLGCYIAAMSAFVFLNEKYHLLDKGVDIVTGRIFNND